MSRKKQSESKSRRRFTEEFKQETLALCDSVGVPEAASTLGLPPSQLYSWRQKATTDNKRNQADAALSAEVAKLKRQLAEKEMEVALLKIPQGHDEASAYFAKNLG